MTQPLLVASRSAATVAEQDWSGAELGLRFGLPVLVLLVGLFVFLGARAQRQEVLDQARAGGIGGPPGTSDVGSAEGFGVEEAQARLRTASGRVLAGLVTMLVGMLALLAVIVWRLVS